MEEKFDHMVMEGNMMVWKWKKMLIIWQWKITWRYENLNILKAIWGPASVMSRFCKMVPNGPKLSKIVKNGQK